MEHNELAKATAIMMTVAVNVPWADRIPLVSIMVRMADAVAVPIRISGMTLMKSLYVWVRYRTSVVRLNVGASVVLMLWVIWD